MAGARVYRDGDLWSWRCNGTCENFGGGARTWWFAIYAANLHVWQHTQGHWARGRS